MPALSIGDREIWYEVSGDGDPVVWLQGTGESTQGWAGHVERLSDRWRCVAIDHRDVGRSSYVAEPYTPHDLAADAAAVMDASQTGAAHVVGYSLGGATAQELALQRPDLVRSLVLLSTWAESDAWFVGQMRNWQSIRRAHWDDEPGFLEALGPWLWSPATYADGRVGAFNRAMAAEEPRQRPDGWIRQCDADIAHQAGSRLRGVTIPAVVIVGEDDVCTPPRYARELRALLPRAELVSIPHAGHGALSEKPKHVGAAIAGFLAAH